MTPSAVSIPRRHGAHAPPPHTSSSAPRDAPRFLVILSRDDRSDAPRTLPPLPSITLPRPASALCPDPPPRCPDPPRARGAAAAPRRAAVALLCDAGDRPGGTAGLPADSRGCGALTAAGGRALCDRSGRARCRAASVDGCRRFGLPRLRAGATPSGVSSVPFLLSPPPPLFRVSCGR